jgi:hypothetical protein
VELVMARTSGQNGSPMRPDLFVFEPDGGPAFELWAPREMRRVEAPESVGALVATSMPAFAPSVVIVHDRVGPDVTLPALIARLEADAAALPGAALQPGRTATGPAGEVRIVAFTHDGSPESGPLYQMTACLLAPPRTAGEPVEAGEVDEVGAAGERDLLALTGTCTVDQMARWDPVFVDAASSVRFG